MAETRHAREGAVVEQAKKLFDHVSNQFEKIAASDAERRVELFPRGIDFISVKVAVGTVTVELAVAGPDARKPPVAEVAALPDGPA